MFKALQDNLKALNATLEYIATSHRPDHKWNPGDTVGGSFGAFGGENIYAFRPDKKERERLSKEVSKARKYRSIDPLSKGELLELMERDVSKLNDPEGQKVKARLQAEAKVRYRTRGENGRLTSASRDISRAVGGQENAFVNIEAKFAVAAPTPQQGRVIVSTQDFSGREVGQRQALFETGRTLFRPGDTVLHRSAAWLMTAIEGDGRLSLFPVDTTQRDRKNQCQPRPTIPARYGQNLPVQRIAYDVLGQRLHRRRKSAGDIQSVPYRLFGQ